MNVISMKPGRSDWRCAHCGKLLGVKIGSAMEIRYKDALYVVQGAVRAVCRGCRTTNHTTVGEVARAS